jgi:muramoyltetrapeptide carboxypeptidase
LTHDFTNFKQHPKWIVVGYYRFTQTMNTMGYKTLHAVMPITVPRATKEAIETLPISFVALAYDIPTANE